MPAARRRRPLVAGNWKMNGSGREAERFAAALCAGLGEMPGGGLEIALFPPFPLIPILVRALAGSGVGVGGQDLHPADAGAHTGDVSGAELADAGCRWVLIGHSERRRDHGETDALVARKLEAARRHELRPIVCVGETREERAGGGTFDVLARQLGALAGGPDLVVAYEPVWAIGTGDTASASTAVEAHRYLRCQAVGRGRNGDAEELRIVYGGSVTPETASGLAREEEIDGCLVGAASLEPGRFLAIISAFAAPRVA